MTTLHETAYPRLKADPTPKELREVYTPTENELAFVFDAIQRPASRLAVLLHLKLFQRLGYFTRLTEVPDTIKNHVARAAGYLKLPPSEQLDRYDDSGAKRAHMGLLRQHLNIRVLDDTGRIWLRSVAEDAAETKNNVPDIINIMLEELVHHRYELPGFTTLERMAQQAREQVNNRYYTGIADLLTPTAKTLIDDMLKVPAGATHSGWQALKREPKKPTNKEVRQYLQHIRQLQHLAEQLPIIDIPVPKLRYFRSMARAMDAAEITELKPIKRYALAVICVRAQYSKTLDDAADLFIRLIQNLESHAQQKLIAYQLEHSKRADMLIGQLKEILQAYDLEGTDAQRVDAIENVLITDLASLLAECEEHMAYAGKNYLPFLIQPYRAMRALLLNCLEIMALRATSLDQTMERMIATLMALRSNRLEVIDAVAFGIHPESDLDWLSAQWRKLILVKAKGKDAPEKLNRKYLELAILLQVKDELKSGDLCIRDGERYDDYREQLIDEETFTQELEEYGQVTGLSTDANAFIAAIKNELSNLAEEVDRGFSENAHADIVDGRLVLKKGQRVEVSSVIQQLDQTITDRLANLSIVDALIDTERWLSLHQDFRPLAGTESRLDDLLMRFITTLFCYGCNLGPTQTAKSIKSFNRRQVAWLNLKYVTEELLDKAVVKVINAYNQFELPGYWGSGKSASADGTKWSVYEQNLLSEYHIRYGGYGGIGYYHVSDKYIALFCHFISCGVHEGVYILDGLMANASDIQPDTVHGDTQAQSYPIFALAHLLGIKLMPRIRNIKDLTFFRPELGAHYKNIDSLFGGNIDWKLIETHLPDMMRVAVSIKLGKITASTILRRLGTYSRKNKLYFAFRELGKAVRTIFLLRYIGDVELRKTINAATNKSEEFNAFVKWVFFGGEGIIAENIQHEQRKIAKYSHLVANMLILHNVEHMTRVLTELKREGMDLSPEVLSGLSPYRTAHINRFGDYTLDFNRETSPLDFNTKILE